MKVTESDCVNCGFPCRYESCPHYKVIRFYCDKCGEETKLYHYDGFEVCEDCLLKEFDIVDGSEW